MTMPKRSEPTPVRLTPEQRAKADRLAGKLAVTRSEAIRRMIDHYPDKETR
jgi:predicted DNA-binding protein